VKLARPFRFPACVLGHGNCKAAGHQIYRENDGWIDRGARRPLLGVMVLGHGNCKAAGHQK